jgi:hypothetical protein
MAESKSGKRLRVTQLGSPIGRTKDQEDTLIGLGLNKAPPDARVAGHAGDPRHDHQGAPTSSRSRRSAEAGNRTRQMKLNQIRDKHGSRPRSQAGRFRGTGSGLGKTSGQRRQGPDRALGRRASTASRAARRRSIAA